ncbi:MAG: hypothetical protein JWN37_244 [Candidatus Nomurabacteria bacterium]|nr:hypothetical protein [Candidatus Nomurabacteria bacterium]
MNKKIYTVNFALILASLYTFALYIISADGNIFTKISPNFYDCDCGGYTYFNYLTISIVGLIAFIVTSSLFIRKYGSISADDEYVSFLNYIGKALFWVFAAYILYAPITYLVSGGPFLSFIINMIWQVVILFLSGYFLYARGAWRSHSAMVVIWAVMAVLAIVSFVGGFFAYGTPSEQYKVSADQETLIRLDSASYDVDDFISYNKVFPTIDQLMEATSTQTPKDKFENPVTHQQFTLTEYKDETPNQYGDIYGHYELCSTVFLGYEKAYDLSKNSSFLKSRQKPGKYCVTRNYSIYNDTTSGNSQSGME